MNCSTGQYDTLFTELARGLDITSTGDVNKLRSKILVQAFEMIKASVKNPRETDCGINIFNGEGLNTCSAGAIREMRWEQNVNPLSIPNKGIVKKLHHMKEALCFAFMPRYEDGILLNWNFLEDKFPLAEPHPNQSGVFTNTSPRDAWLNLQLWRLLDTKKQLTDSVFINRDPEGFDHPITGATTVGVLPTPPTPYHSIDQRWVICATGTDHCDVEYVRTVGDFVLEMNKAYLSIINR